MEMIRLCNYFLTCVWVMESRNPRKPGSVLLFLGDNLPQSHCCASQRHLHLAALWNVGAILHFKFMRHFVSGSCCLTEVLLALWTGDKILNNVWAKENYQEEKRQISEPAGCYVSPSWTYFHVQNFLIAALPRLWEVSCNGHHWGVRWGFLPL